MAERLRPEDGGGRIRKAFQSFRRPRTESGPVAEQQSESSNRALNAVIECFGNDNMKAQVPDFYGAIVDFGLVQCRIVQHYGSATESNEAAKIVRDSDDPFVSEEPMIEFHNFIYGAKVAYYLKMRAHGNMMPHIESEAMKGAASSFNLDIEMETEQKYSDNCDQYFMGEHERLVGDAVLLDDLHAMKDILYENKVLVPNEAKFMAGAAYTLGLYERYVEDQLDRLL